MSTRSRLLTALAATIAAIVYAAVQLRVVLTADPGAFRALRTAFWHDQLGYLSIVADVATGNLDSVEPVTVTGVNHYPRTYYALVGLAARATGMDAVTAWNLISSLIQIAAVVMLSVVMSVLARRWWVGAFAPLPFFTGTLSAVTSGSWLTGLEHHAVLWGPYGVLFSNNAETAGLSIIVIVLSALALVWARPARRSARITVSVLAAAALGSLSGFQTYSFITGIYLVSAILAANYLRRAHWGWIAATAAAVLVVVLAGPLIADRVGQLPTLVFGLLPAAPGLIRGLLATRGALALYAAITVATAAPQIGWTVSGILGGDPFLAYRVASNVNLGVVDLRTAIASLPVVLPFLLITIIAARRRDTFGVAALIGTAVTAAMLALNDLWGANAEPYRFWIDLFLLGGVVLALGASRLYGGVPTRTEARSSDQHATRTTPPWIRAGVAVCALVYVVSLADLWLYSTDATMNATWNPGSSRESAIAAAAHAADSSKGGLIVSDTCIDPRTTKVVSAAPIAYFYLGMAWPAEVDAVSEVMSGRDDDLLPADSLVVSDTRWLVTDSTCATTPVLDGAEKTREDSFDYAGTDGSGSITLWRLSTP
ncbi:hypothetical protein [Microbacterium lacus]|uniref:hypothetical protein n=1 Tax=Microbacterium lacus TaxID=415217 RepID=UPI000C2C2592|nr:hypothetical protein [Microbacterium lacus]